MGKNLFDLGDPFVRELWSFILPIAFVLVFCITLLPIPNFLRPFFNAICAPFRPFLSIQEAEALLAASSGEAEDGAFKDDPPPLWRTAVLTWVALFEVLVWLAFGTYRLATHSSDIWSGIGPIVIATTWLYAALRPILAPSPIVMYDLLSLYLVHTITGLLNVGGFIFDNRVYEEPLPEKLVLLAHAANLAALIVLLLVLLNMPIGVPSAKVNREEIGKSVSPEDYCTLWQWISFHWVLPLIARGTYDTLNEEDVWKLSPNNQSRAIFLAFNKQSGGLLLKLWKANSFDLILDCVLTFVSVVFQYSGPFFLQRILSAIDDPTPESTARAYIYAFLAFLGIVLKVF
jgi:hypothetical protein